MEPKCVNFQDWRLKSVTDPTPHLADQSVGVCVCMRAWECVWVCAWVHECVRACVRFLALVIYSSKELHLLSFHCVWTNEWRGTNLSWLSVLLRCRGQQQNIFPNEFLSKTWWSKSCIFRPNKSNWSLSPFLWFLSLSLSLSLFARSFSVSKVCL